MPKKSTLQTTAQVSNASMNIVFRYLFVITLCISSFLLFLIQPMFTKLVLPLLGGAPAIWNTAMIFFQAMLLSGYVYAHYLSTRLTLRSQIVTHLLLMLAALIFLPIAISSNINAPSEEWPVTWLLWLFTSSIGLPFFIISANAPLLQSWFKETRDTHAKDPYFLYASSNIGSIIALIAYPIYIEINFGLKAQSTLWSAGFIVLLSLIFFCGIFLKRNIPTDVTHSDDVCEPIEQKAPTLSNYVHWVLLAIVPSALFLSLTNKITTDLLAIPLLWVIPLGLYLLTFVVTFSRKPVITFKTASIIAPYFLIAAAAFNIPTITPSTVIIFITGNLICFFFIALYCHGKLVSLRPNAKYLTNFYIAMSVGGVLGGIFVGIVAPAIFDKVYEYAIILITAATFMPTKGKSVISITAKILGTRSQSVLADIMLPLLILGLSWLISLVQHETDLFSKLLAIIISSVIILLLIEGIGRPLRFISSIIICLLIGGQFGNFSNNNIFTDRSFFGVYNVQEIPTYKKNDQPVRIAKHGTTVHGIQIKGSLEPLSYYHHLSGLGLLMAAYKKNNQFPSKVAAIGLGAGTALCYKQPNQEWTFFEIDPLVERLARDQSLFTYLSECGPVKDIIIGDARLSLEEIKNKEYDLLISDAFSSDSIPVHLITKEAFDIYKSKIQDNGIILIHISNRYFNLEPVIAQTAKTVGLQARVYNYVGKKDVPSNKPYFFTTIWVALAKDQGVLDQLLPITQANSVNLENRWRNLVSDPSIKVWTDDYSHVLSTLK